MSIKAERLEADVTVNTKPGEKSLKQFDDKTKSTSGGLKAAKVAVMGFAGAAAGSVVVKAIGAASDLNETLSKTGVVFGEQTKAVTGYAQTMADKFGLPKTAVLDAASSFGLLGQAAGITGTPLAKMSTGLAGLAADAASFYNVPLEQALGDFSSALAGESEPVKKYGVLMNEAAVQTEALALGIVKPVKNTKTLASAQVAARIAQEKYNAAVKDHGKGSSAAQAASLALGKAQDAVAKAAKGTVPALTEGQKVQARTSLLMKGMTKASGDLERTQNSVANRTRELSGRLQNYAADLGQKALPAVNALLGGVIDLVKGLSGLPKTIQENEGKIKAVAAIIGAVLVPMLITWGVQSTISAAKSVAAWAKARAASFTTGIQHVKTFALMIAGWVRSAAAAVASGARTVAVWALYKAEAVKGAAQAVVSQARITAAWLAGAAKQAAVMAATVAKTVAGWVLMGAQSLLAAAKIALAWVISMGPIALVIAAVIGLVVLIVKNWDKIKAVTVAAWQAIVGALSAAWEWIKSAAAATWNWVVGKVKAVLGALKAAVVWYFTTYIAIIQGVWNTIKSVTVGAWNGIKGAVTGAIGGLLGVVKGLPGKVLAALYGLSTLLYNSGKAIIQGLIDGIVNMAGNVGNAVKGVLKKARDLLPFSPAKKGPFSGKGWTLYSGRAISNALAQGIRDRASNVRQAALGLANAAVPPMRANTTPQGTLRPSSRANGPANGPTPAAVLGPQANATAQTVQFITYYPIAEPQSKTTNRALQRVAALSLV